MILGTINGGCKLVAVCGTDKKRLAAAGDKHKVPTYTDYHVMLINGYPLLPAKVII